MEITYMYQRVRRDFGRSCTHFTDRPPDLLDDFVPDASAKDLHVERNPTNLSLQSLPECSEHEANTERFTYHHVGMSHMEGGWPKDVDPTEKEQTARFRKKVEKDEEYVRQIIALGDVVEHSIKQNNALDIYEEYFAGEYADHSSEEPSAKTLSVFKDPSEVKRTVAHISWYPDAGKKIAIAFSMLQFQDPRMEKMSYLSYIWDVNNPNQPEQEIAPSSPLCCLEYNPKDPHLLVGGSYNGIVSYWDTRKGHNPEQTSLIENSHRDPVYDITWVQSKTGYECASTSTDGQVLWWDIRKLGEPTDALMLEKEGVVLGGVNLEYSAAGGPTKFMVGTEQGVVVNCNRKAKTPSDRIGGTFAGHHGPIYALQRNPFFPKYFMTIGDWTVRLWMEELRTPIMTSRYHSAYILDFCWSPTRPGVFLATKMDGTLDIWDYFYKQNEPVLSLQVDDDGLFAVKMQEQGTILATGSVDGSIYMLELCDGLSVMQHNEKKMISEMLERETKREKNLEARAKEMRIKERKDAENKNKGGQTVVSEETLKKVEEEFWVQINEHEAKEEAGGDGKGK